MARRNGFGGIAVLVIGGLVAFMLSRRNGGGGGGLVVDFTATVNNLTATFQNTSLGAASYRWAFGDGQISVAATPSHTYLVSGSYSVTLTAFDTAGAELSTTKSVTVVGLTGFIAGVFVSFEFLAVPIAGSFPPEFSCRARHYTARNTGNVVTSYSSRLIAYIDGSEVARNRDDPTEWNDILPGAVTAEHTSDVRVGGPGILSAELQLLERLTGQVLDTRLSGNLVTIPPADA